MFRACLAFAFVFTLAASGFSQTNSEKVSQVPGMATVPPRDSSLRADSAQAAAKSKRKTDARAQAKAREKASADSAKAVPAPVPAPAPAGIPAPVPTPAAVPDSSKAAAPPAGTPDSLAAAPIAEPRPQSPSAGDSLPASASGPALAEAAEPKREPQDFRLFNDPTLIAKEYGFGILGSVVAGALGFYIGSGIETAVKGNSRAHKGTLTFTGIRYDNFQGAFWGGATGMVFGSALTTYFVGQTDEEDGGLFLTLAGTAAAASGAYYLAHLMGVNDDIDWKPFIPLLTVPTLGGVLGFNVSRWYHDRKREQVVGGQASLWIHPPRLAWGRDAGGDRLEVQALNLTF